MFLKAHAEFGKSYSLLSCIAFGAAILLYFAPLVFFDRIPTQDGPLHIDTVAVMLNSLRTHENFFQQFFQIRLPIETNTFGHDILLVCFTLAPTAERAEKLFQFIYLGIFLGGLGYFLTAIRQSAWKLVPLGLPFAYSYLFHMGFYNYCLSICGFLWSWGVFWRCMRRLTLGRFAALSVVAFLTWLAHPVGTVAFACGAFFWAALRLVILFFEPAGARSKELKALAASLIVVAAPFAGEFLFLCKSGGPNQWVFETWSELGTRLANLSAMDSFGLPGIQNGLKIIAEISAALLILGFAGAIRQWHREKKVSGIVFSLMTLFYLAVYFLSPTDAAGSGYINERLMPCAFFFCIGLLAAVSSAVTERALLIGGTAFLAALHFADWPVYTQAEKIERDYLFAVGEIQPGSILYPMHLSSHGFDGRTYPSFRADFMVHLAGFYTAGSQSIYLNNTIARWHEGRQISFKPDVLRGLEGLPPAFPGTPTNIDFESFRQSVGRPVDYVVLYGDFSSPESLAVYYEQIVRKQFDCSLVSPLGLVKLCKKL